MKIAQNTSTVSPSDLATQTTISQPEQADVDYFAAQLNTEPTLTVEKVAPPSEIPAFMKNMANAINHNESERKQSYRDLETASRSSNLLEFSKANAALSNYYIESLMNAKIVSKTVQSLDKLTNLQ